MAFGEQLETEKQPTDFCIGRVTGAENLRDSKNNPDNKVIDVKIDPIFASRKKDKGETLYLVVREAWFQPGHSPEDLEPRAEKFMYNNFFGKKGRTGLIQQLLDPAAFDVLGQQVTNGGLSVEGFVDFLNEHATGRVIGYVLKQGRDSEVVTDPETGNEKKEYYLTDFKGVDGLFTASDVQGLEGSAERAADKALDDSAEKGEKVKPSMRIFWEAGSDPFQTIAEAALTA